MKFRIAFDSEYFLKYSVFLTKFYTILLWSSEVNGDELEAAAILLNFFISIASVFLVAVAGIVLLFTCLEL